MRNHPDGLVRFTKPWQKPQKTELELYNPSQELLVFRLTSPDPRHLSFWPVFGCISPREAETAQILWHGSKKHGQTRRDHFRLDYVFAQSGHSAESNEALTLWDEAINESFTKPQRAYFLVDFSDSDGEKTMVKGLRQIQSGAECKGRRICVTKDAVVDRRWTLSVECRDDGSEVRTLGFVSVSRPKQGPLTAWKMDEFPGLRSVPRQMTTALARVRLEEFPPSLISKHN